MRRCIFSLIFCSFSLPFAFADRPNECPTPGVKISSEFLGLVSDGATLKFSRKGAIDVPQESFFSAKAVATISKNFKNLYCILETYKIEEQKCSPVNIDLAMGRGNATFKSFYNLSMPLLARAELFMRTLTYDTTAEAGSRLEAAEIIVGHLTVLASATTIPNNWLAFTTALNTISANGEVNKVVIDDLTTTYLAQNKDALGFNPMRDVEIKEEVGNDIFGSLFDLSITEFERAKVIQNNIKGVANSDKILLARDFISFASVTGTPDNWTQFTIMLKTAIDHKRLELSEYEDIVGKFEALNRENLGFKITATKCVIVQKELQVNELKTRIEKEFHSKVTKAINLKVVNGPLLLNESEMFSVYYDGLNPEVVKFFSKFNAYELSSATAEGDFILTGSRLRAAAPNTSHAKIVKTNDILDVLYQNTGYNEKIGGKLVVVIDFYEYRFFGDKYLGSKTILPVDGNLVKYMTQIKMQNSEKQPYIEVKLKFVGSSFYNEEFSEPVRFDL